MNLPRHVRPLGGGYVTWRQAQGSARSLKDSRHTSDTLCVADQVSTTERLELLLIHRMNVERQLEETTASLAAIDYKIGLYQERLSA